VPPEFYGAVVDGLANANLNIPISHEMAPKILIEKPFGYDSGSVKEFDGKIRQWFDESQIFRVDHYLGKNGLWNILEERRSHPTLEERLNSKYVERICVRILEKNGIEGRGEYYDNAGALRDVGQNHLLQMAAFALVELSHTARDLCNNIERAKVLDELEPVGKHDVSDKIELGQYDGYQNEKGVNPDSSTETYFKISTAVLNKRWRGTEVILESGKAIGEKRAEVEYCFKDGTNKVFDVFENPDAYEVLIEKAAEGDGCYFVSPDEVAAQWKFISSILSHKKDIPLKTYPRYT